MRNAWKLVIVIMSLTVVCLILAAVITLNNLRSQPDTRKNNPSKESQMNYHIDMKQDTISIRDSRGDLHVIDIEKLKRRMDSLK